MVSAYGFDSLWHRQARQDFTLLAVAIGARALVKRRLRLGSRVEAEA